MRILSWARSLWANLAQRSDVNAALDEELRAYVDLLAADHQRNGLSAESARRAALLDCGGVEQVKESTRDAWIGNFLVTSTRELRFVLRSLRRAPVYVITAVATLGIGIGGATALFTLVKGSLLRPLPSVTEPDRLVSIEPMRGSVFLYDFSYPYFRDLHDQSTSLRGLAVYDGTYMALRDSTGSSRVGVSYVSGEFFAVLGVRPVAGRLLLPADVNPDAPSPAVVISYEMWQHHYSGSKDVVGRRITLNGYPLTVVGVAPKGFIGAMALHAMDMWIPITTLSAIFHTTFSQNSRHDGAGRLVGRLAPGRTLADAQRELTLLAARLAASYAEDKDRSVHVYAGAGMTTEERAEASRMPRLLAAAVAVLLLIACANVANLSLVRAAARRRELATRLALGASRASLVGRLVLESAVLAIGAAVCGVLLAQVLVRWGSVVRTVVWTSDLDLRLDGPVLAMSIAICIVTIVLVSIAPAIQTTRLPVGAVLKDGASGAVRRRSLGQRALVVVQVGASLVLLLSAAIVFGAVRRALSTDPGFDVHGVTVAFLNPHEAALDSARQVAFYRDVLVNAAAERRVVAAGLVSTIPPAPWATPSKIYRRGEEPPPGTSAQIDVTARQLYVDYVAGGAFDALGIPLLLGRDFTLDDDDRAPPVAIVSKRAADVLWPNENPIGKLLVWPSARFGSHATLRVVGVVGDTRYAAITAAPPPVMFVPYAQHVYSGNLTLVLRDRSGAIIPDSLLGGIVRSAAPGVSVSPDDITQRIAGQVEPQRRASVWIGAFGAIALLLATIGLYGIVAQEVLQRTRELAVRAAVGASPAALCRLVIGDGLRLTAIGIAFGALASMLAVRALQSMFTGLGFVDPRACVIAVVTLVVATLAASFIPGRRAAHLSPVEALRSD